MEIKRTGAAEYGRWVKSLICGEPGAGKTLISSTWPDVFYANVEGGLMSVADRQVAYADVKTSADLAELRSHLDKPRAVREETFGQPVGTVVLDTIDEIQKLLVRERLRETKKEALVLQDWGWLGEQMQSIVRGFRNLDMHVIFLCHLKTERDEEAGRMFGKPGLQGAIADQIPGYVDLSLLLKARSKTIVEGKETKRITERVLQTQPDAQYGWIKDRSGKLPFEFEVNFSDDFSRLHELIFGGIEALPETLMLRKETTPPPPPPAVLPQDIAPRGSAPAKETPSVEAKREASIARKNVVTPVAPPATIDPETGEILEPATEKEEPSLFDKVVSNSEGPADTSSTGLEPCEQCGGEIESESQRNISKIRFRKSLCKSCFKNPKKEG